MTNTEKLKDLPVSDSSPSAREAQWDSKIKKAQEIRKAAAEARKGKPMAFPTGLRRV